MLWKFLILIEGNSKLCVDGYRKMRLLIKSFELKMVSIFDTGNVSLVWYFEKTRLKKYGRRSDTAPLHL